MTGTMSILALYNWDDSIFSELQLPEGVERDTLIYNLLFDCAEMELLYSDWEFMHDMIGRWSVKELPTWNRVAAASAITYNPIENYNRTETATETENGNRQINNVQSSVGSSNTSVDRLGKVAGYNAESMVNRNEDVDSGSSNSSGSVTDEGSENTINSRTRHSNVSGNIGVTTSQQMLEQELEIVPKLNIYDYIIRSFKNRFCLLIYT